MIDDKKIEEAATVASISDTEKGRVRESYVINALGDHESGFREGYIEGAKWAIDEFLKDLWHPSSEKPKYNKVLFVQYHQLGRKDPWYITLNIGKITNWRDTVADFLIQRWCYIDDLLPKEGGEQ